MTLKGEARTKYMRDYMRRRRAERRAKAPGLTAKPVKPSPAPDDAVPLVDPSVVALIAELEEHLAQAHKRIAEHREHIENAHKRIAERDEYIERLRQRLEESGQKFKQLSAKFEKLEAEARRGKGQLTRGRRESGRPVEFTEVGRLRAEIGKLKFDISKLKAALQEEPDAAKLRKKVIDQQTEMASLRRNIKILVKERDDYRARVQTYKHLKHAEARRLLTRENYGAIIKALHTDRLKQCSPAELATAHMLVTALRPLFDEKA